MFCTHILRNSAFLIALHNHRAAIKNPLLSHICNNSGYIVGTNSGGLYRRTVFIPIGTAEKNRIISLPHHKERRPRD